MAQNSWSRINPKDYDLHMGNENVAQLQMQKTIINEQIGSIPQEEHTEIAILGVTNGNGLEEAEKLNVKTIIGIDISRAFLDECQKRYGYLGNRLKLKQIDLVNERQSAVEVLNNTRLIIANIVIEHIHLDNFIELIKKLESGKRTVSCVIQYNPDGSFASKSGHEHAFDEILPMAQDINKDELTEKMEQIGYSLKFHKDYLLPNKKVFVRLDFENK